MFGWLSAACLSLAALNACTSINNPFNPRAELRILDVSSSEEGRFVGIRQSATKEAENTFIIYTYAEPVLRLESRTGFPVVNFNRFTARISLADGTNLPAKEYPLTKGSVEGQEISIQFPIMSADRDVQNVVFPGNNAPRVRDGRAEIVLYGVDVNGNNIEIPVSVPLSFESTIFSDSPLPPTAPTPVPSPSPSATEGE